MSRIESNKINFGNSFTINTEGNQVLNKEVVEAKKIAEKIVADAKLEAQGIIAQAHTQAENLIKQARLEAESQAETITEAAKEDGFNAGYSEGKEKITTELEDRIQNVDEFAKCTFELKNKIIKSAHLDILDLITDIAKKVCKQELSQNPRILRTLVEESINQLSEKEEITIIANPEMINKLYAIADDMKSKIHGLKTIKIQEDSSVSADGTIIESLDSRIDTRMSGQIEQIYQKLINEMNSVPEAELANEVNDMNLNNDKFNQI